MVKQLMNMHWADKEKKFYKKKTGNQKRDSKGRFETREKGARGFHLRQAESVPEEKNLQGIQGEKERAQGY